MVTIVRSIISSVFEGAIKRFSGSGRKGEQFNSREYFQHYGFTSSPHAGAEGIVCVQGNIIHLLATDDRRYRIALEEGEVALYTDEGDKIHFKRGNIIHVSTSGTVQIDAAAALEITSKAISINGDLQINGNIIQTGNFEQVGSPDQTGITTTGNITDALGNLTEHVHPRT